MNVGPDISYENKHKVYRGPRAQAWLAFVDMYVRSDLYSTQSLQSVSGWGKLQLQSPRFSDGYLGSPGQVYASKWSGSNTLWRF